MTDWSGVTRYEELRDSKEKQFKLQIIETFGRALKEAGVSYGTLSMESGSFKIEIEIGEWNGGTEG